MITWYSEITWQTKTITSSLPQYLWLPSLGRCWLTLRHPYLKSQKALESRDLVISCDKLKTYFHYPNTYDHQAWRDCDLPWGAPTHKVIWPLDQLFLRDPLKNEKHIPQLQCLLPPDLAECWLSLRGSFP